MQTRIVARLSSALALAAIGAWSLALGVASTASAADAPEPKPDANGNKACAVYAWNKETQKTEIYEWIDHGGIRTSKSGMRMRCDNGTWKLTALYPGSPGTTGSTSGTLDGAFTGTTRTTGSTSGTVQP